MTRDEITRMAREAGFVGMDGLHKGLCRFAALVAAAEREVCAKALEAAPQPQMLIDERIFDLLKQVDPHAVSLPLGFKQFAIAIEREILGGQVE